MPKPLVEHVITRILSQTPLAKQIYTAYVLADGLFDNWNTIAQLYGEYQKRGAQGVTSIIGTNAVHNALSSIQTEAIWATIGGYIPKECRDISKEILANFMNTITTAEIALAKQFLKRVDYDRIEGT